MGPKDHPTGNRLGKPEGAPRRKKALNLAVIKFFASGAYVGYSPLASGTLGTLWGIPLYFWLSRYSPGVQGGVIVLLILTAVYVADRAARIWDQKDPSRVVADEIVGYLVSVCWIPLNWFSVIGGFLIFRLMDITKPFPIRKIDREMRGGWGIVLDDVLAGIYTNILLRIILLITGN
jgi:phosphatidylglycerophosphatase A